MSNVPTVSQQETASSKPLPFTAGSDRALIYIVYTYREQFLALPGVGIAGSSSSYQGSEVSVSDSTGNAHYISPLLMEPVCFSVSPGTYSINIKNHIGVNETQLKQKSINVHRNKNYFFSIDANSNFNKKPELTFRQLKSSEGRYYVLKSPPKSCKTLKSFHAPMPNKYILDVHINNKTSSSLEFYNNMSYKRPLKIIDSNKPGTFTQVLYRNRMSNKITQTLYFKKSSGSRNQPLLTFATSSKNPNKMTVKLDSYNSTWKNKLSHTADCSKKSVNKFDCNVTIFDKKV